MRGEVFEFKRNESNYIYSSSHNFQTRKKMCEWEERGNKKEYYLQTDCTLPWLINSQNAKQKNLSRTFFIYKENERT